MMSDYKRDIDNKIDQEQDKEEIKWESSLSNFSEWILNVQQLLYPTFINDHLCDVFIFILFCNIQG